MTMTETELRDLLAGDSAGPPGRVTVADVGRRVRRMRRRRAAAGVALAAGVAAVALAPRTIPVAADDTWIATPASPAPTPSVMYIPDGRVVLDEEIGTGGLVRTYPYTGGSGPATVQVACRVPSYVFLWLDGDLIDQGPCGIQSDHVDRLRSWTDHSGRDLKGRHEVGVAVVPAERVGQDRQAALTRDQVAALLGATGRYPVSARLTVREAWPVTGVGMPQNCRGDVVIRNGNGQEVHSSWCDLQPGIPFPGDGPSPS
ncbi:hypothetical protein GCM10009530_20220 [Microbispora corallina]|uniref:Uncharacterized protein n=1 Tax=Microbispora corallina TaxID=83302 RepID=A0ABQ4FU28_9ACTN|nr:hypothetical protein [Microbispora corallina]GIH38318.1 hypothetical protein Mco01_13180 [Microbispora corallina]